MASSSWLAVLGAAQARPRDVAERWRAGGGRVVGVFGHQAPRELVSGVGMLPIPLSADRLPGAADAVLPGLSGELSADALGLLSALLGGELGWIDGLLIGRDSEAHTKLFYVLREMAADAEFRAQIPPLAFSDVLRLPLRTSSVYNRVRLRELAEVLAGWAGREFDPEALRQAIDESILVKRQLRDLRRLRASGLITATDSFLADVGARTLPAAEARAALTSAAATAEQNPQRPLGPTVFVTGSEPRASIYAALDAAGLTVVGDDHEWGEEHSGLREVAGDAIDWLADNYQFSSAGAARAGLDRVRLTVERARDLGAAGVLQVILPGDEASGWELAELRAQLPQQPVISVELDVPGSWDQQLRDAAAALRAQLSRSGSGGEVLSA